MVQGWYLQVHSSKNCEIRLQTALDWNVISQKSPCKVISLGIRSVCSRSLDVISKRQKCWNTTKYCCIHKLLDDASKGLSSHINF